MMLRNTTYNPFSFPCTLAAFLILLTAQADAFQADGRVYRQRVEPHWIGSSDRFWYRNDLPEDQREFLFVDPDQGLRERAFDHQAVAQAMGNGVQALRLPIERLFYSDEDRSILLIGPEKSFRWTSSTSRLEPLEQLPPEAVARNEASNSNSRRRRVNGEESSILFENQSQSTVEIFWLNGEGGKQSYGKIAPGTSRQQHTFGGHRWLIIDENGKSLGRVMAKDSPSTVVLDGSPLPPEPPRRRAPSPERVTSEFPSPDGKWKATIQDHNVVVFPSDSGDRIVLSHDGVEGESYAMLQWSPDSRCLLAFRQKSVERLPVHWIRSSPPEGGRAQLESRPYVLPGDPFPTYELNLFLIDKQQQIKPQVDRFEHEWMRPEPRFRSDGTKITYEQIDRGHRRFRLLEVDLRDGSVRNLIDEVSETFIWTAHTENHSVPRIQWLENGRELIYATEKYGWRQLILVDANDGVEKRILTPTGIVVRSIEWIDETNRRIGFGACGREPPHRDGPNLEGSDPYLTHFGTVDMDTGELIWFTEGNGNHAYQLSPSKKFAIDTYSRVDMAPITELRDVLRGSKVCDLEAADITSLQATGWRPPEVFVAKGRDQQTDIWGIICRPKDFDPSRKYPVIEDIYAGPQDSYAPKSFSPSQYYDSLTRLGFIVVKLDGMGTANRSKAFHDVCWKNLKDAGFPDRIAWMRAAAAKYPEMDLSRVGVYGVSAGGQNAAGAVLFHPEFYKVAVAGCGCHDNRMDKASWNEQWMGYPVGDHYSACSNIDNAHRLEGKLLLIVGEMDTNVPPESTMRFADALIRANKDFDLLVVPNGGHGIGGSYGERRMRDYFVQHLLNPTPPPTQAAIRPPQRPQRVQAKTVAAASTQPLPTQSTPTQLPTIQPPPSEFFDLVDPEHRDQARSFYQKYVDIHGLPVVAAEVVADEALWHTHEIVSRMLAGRPDILKNMQRSGMYLIIIGKDQVYTDMPEYSDHPDPAFQNERVRGTGGKPTSFGEENLLCLALDRYDDESIAVHEFCHTIDGTLHQMDPEWKDRLESTFEASQRLQLYHRAYAGTNAGEYWAEICQAYFDCNRINNWNHGPIGTREQLKLHDPDGFELVRSTFQLLPDQDWRYKPRKQQPSVESPPTKFKIDPFYTKFTWARELPIVGRKAEDEAMLIANHIVRKMFAYRHDILKALIAADVKLVVLGHGEALADLPEFHQRSNELEPIDLLVRWSEYSPETKILAIDQENVKSSHQPNCIEDCWLVHLLADAVYQVAAQRPVDRDWENRPRHVWQQYELRVQRIDQRLDDSLSTLFDAAKSGGKWQGTRASTSRRAYWNYGVMAYFNALGQTPSPLDHPRPVRTREELERYDPDLFQLVNTTFQYDQRVDWRVR